MTRRPTPAESAREHAGLTLAAVARYLRTTPEAIRRLECAGRGWSDLRAERLAKLYGCSLECFPPAGKARALSPSIRRAKERRL